LISEALAMAILDFYALGEDLGRLFTFIYSETDIVVYEHSSAFDQEPRRYESLNEIGATYKLGKFRAGYLQLWSPSIMDSPVIRRIELKVPGHSFRYAVEGAGLMQLYLDGVKDDVIYHTHFGHWNEAGARQRSMHPADDCDWQALSKISGSIQRHIRGKLAAGKLYARPILSQAFDAVQQGSRLWFGPNAHGFDSKDIQKLADGR
jgi:hypothetical protein